jgi:hypothetical protein
MLDPAVTFARPSPDHRAKLAPPYLPVTISMQPGVGHETVAAEPTLRAPFLSQLTETFAPPPAIFWEGDAAGHVFHVLEGCLRVSRVLQDGRRAILGSATPAISGAFRPQLLPLHGRGRYPRSAQKAAEAPL